MTPITIIILAAIGLVVLRQFQAREMRTGPLVAIPLMLIGLGVEALPAAHRSALSGSHCSPRTSP